MKIYCMSDIHGCLAEFEEALSVVIDQLDKAGNIRRCGLNFTISMNLETGNLYVDRVSMNAFHYIFFHRRADFGW